MVRWMGTCLFVGAIALWGGCADEPPADDDATGDDDTVDDDDTTGDDDSSSAADDDDSAPADLDGDGWTEAQGDCDDGDPAVHPGAEELCNGVDDDCDGVLADGEDADADGDGALACDDCDDSDATVLPGAAGVHHVPDDHASIPDAIAAAAPGDTICVRPGTWVGIVALQGRDVRLVGMGGPEGTILDGDELGSVVIIDRGEGPDTIVEGFTITGGRADDQANGHASGAGIRVSGSSPTLRHLVVTGNTVAYDSFNGGGIDLTDSSSTLSDIHVHANTVEGGRGGGIQLTDCHNVYLEDVVVEANSCHGEPGGGISVDDSVANFSRVSILENTAFGGDGGGLAIDCCHVSLEDVEVRGNSTTAGGEGGGVFVGGGVVAGEHVQVSQNTSDQSGGGWSITGGSIVELSNGEIWENQGDCMGGGLTTAQTASVTLDHVSILANTAQYGGGVYDGGPYASLSNVIVAGNVADADGGGIWIGFGMVEIAQTAVVNNTAATTGGIHIADANVSLVGVSVSNNTGGAGGGISASGMVPDIRWSNSWGNSPDDYHGFPDPTNTSGNLSGPPQYVDRSHFDHAEWNFHVAGTSPLIDAGDPAVTDPGGSPTDIGAYGGPGADGWDLDHDGYFLWWLPGAYDPVTSPGMDCDDRDAAVYPGAGC